MRDITLWKPADNNGRVLANEIERMLSKSGYSINVFVFNDINVPYLIVDWAVHFGGNAMSMAIILSRNHLS